MAALNFTRLINLYSHSGENLDVDIFLHQKPRREQQKYQTLSKYIEKYPSGWKKRLEFADLLYEMGEWSQAIEQYQIVIERQPQLVSVRLKLAKIWQILGSTKDAIAIYKSCLDWIDDLQLSHSLSLNVSHSHKANKFHILGLIALCRQNYSEAIKNISGATIFSPDNCCHWLALGQAYQQNQQYLDALKAFDAILSYQPDDLVALLHIYDVLVILSELEVDLPHDISHLHADNDKITPREFWLIIAEERLQRAINLSADSYQVLYRQISLRCLKKQVLGVEGKKTQRLINLLIKIAPTAKQTQEIKQYFQQLQQETKSNSRDQI